jgi:hypothetical protein
MAVLADAAPCGPVPGRTSKRQWTVPLPAVQQAAAAVSVPMPQSRVSTVPAACGLRVSAGRVRCPSGGPSVSAGCADLARNPGVSAEPDTAAVSAGRPGVRPVAGRTAALRRGHDRGAPEQGRDMAIAGSRPSMHAPPATRWTQSPSTVSAAVAEPGRGRLSRPGCPPDGGLPQPAGHCGQCPLCVRNRGRPAMVSGRPGVHRGHRRLRGGWCYRKRSPDRWPLVWCRHCR